MSRLSELYQEVIVEHYNKPRNFRRLEEANRHAEGYNPLCGDRIILYLKVQDGVVLDVGFVGSGCAISKASASMMTESIKGKSKAEVEELFRAFHSLVTGETLSDADYDKLGDLETLSGVSRFPIRVKCATLVWHTLRAALEEKEGSISTE